MRFSSPAQTEGLLLHIVAETPGSPASIIHSAHDAAEHGDTAITPAPSGAEFMEGDIFALIVENDICVCTTNLRDQTLASYLRDMLQIAGADDECRAFEIQPVGNADKLRLIARGVKRIDLGATVQEATVSYARRRNEPRDLLGAVGRELQRLLGNDVRDIPDNLQVNVEIYSDGRLRTGVREGEQRLQHLARDLVESRDDDYTILTKDGQSISQSEVFIRTKMDIERIGKSLNRQAAWTALRRFYASLAESGITGE